MPSSKQNLFVFLYEVFLNSWNKSEKGQENDLTGCLVVYDFASESAASFPRIPICAGDHKNLIIFDGFTATIELYNCLILNM